MKPKPNALRKKSSAPLNLKRQERLEAERLEQERLAQEAEAQRLAQEEENERLAIAQAKAEDIESLREECWQIKLLNKRNLKKKVSLADWKKGSLKTRQT